VRERETVLDRLTTADMMMLRPEEYGWREDIGALAFLDGPVDLDDARSLVLGRLEAVPKLRKVLRVQPWGLGTPIWVDAPTFDIAEHVGRVELTRMDDSTVLAEVERLRRRPFDRDRPLWELWLLAGPPDGPSALYAKLHHTLADGAAGVLLIGALLDPPEGTPEPTPRRWVPAPEPGRARILADNVGRWATEFATSGRRLLHPVALARALGDRRRSLWAVLAHRDAPATSVNRPVGEARRLAVVRGDLARTKALAHAHGATVNDVLVAQVAGAYRRLLLHRGEPVDDVVLRGSIPVSLHADDASGALANADGMIFAPFPVGIADLGERIEAVARETAELKQHVTPPATGMLVATRTAQRAFWRSFATQRWSNAYVADVPGPTEPLSLARVRLREVFAIVPIMGNLTIGVGAFSYAGQLNTLVVADADACPDLDVFLAGMTEPAGGPG